MPGKFKNQVVWITGASSGIGAALAKAFYMEGAVLALSARRVERLQDLANGCGERAHIYPLDVQKRALVEETALKIAQSLGRIDVVVANAGYGVSGPLETLTEAIWRNLFETNVFGVIWTLQAAIPHVKKTKGRLAITGSVMGKLAVGNLPAYSASKFALMGLANSLYQELHKCGVSVTTLLPGWVESEIGQVDNLGRLRPKKPASPKNSFLRWPAEKAAQAMVSAIYQRKREEVITGHGKVAAFLGTHLAPLTYWGMAKLANTSPRRSS
jgi:short-subunit dehydrogenase